METGFFAEAFLTESEATEFALKSEKNFVVIKGSVINSNGVLIFQDSLGNAID